MKSLLRLLLKSQHRQNRYPQAQTEKGMTLIELLIGTVMAFLIITPMLGFVVDMLNTDRREQVKSNTEQDIQAAVDFIAQDLSQAIYIYDNNDINVGTNGTPAIRNQLPDFGNQNRIPILVFWKRQLIKTSVPINSLTVKPNTCLPNNANQCNDTYVLTLVAYYQFKDNNDTWCQPLGDNCPTRIARYEIRDGLRNPNSPDKLNQPYYSNGETNDSQKISQGFNPNFDLTNKPMDKVTLGPPFPPHEVLVNYIDHTTGAAVQPIQKECENALGNPTATAPGSTTPSAIPETTLRVTDPDLARATNSFYACVDKTRNLARVTIRGNSLRRLQTDAKYDASKSAFFPTATVQVQGLGARGK